MFLAIMLERHPEVLELWRMGDSRRLRDRADAAAPRIDDSRARVLIIAIDGVRRDVLYPSLEAGELPGLARLLGGRAEDALRHAHLERSLSSVLPSDTIPNWASVFTGAPPGEHGLPGNEVFVRERLDLVAPIPVSFGDVTPVLETYTDDYVDRHLEVPTVYQRLREREPQIRIWVTASQVHAGADRLLLANRSAFAQALATRIEDALGESTARSLYAEVDEELAGNLIEELGSAPLPDVLTLYLPGADLFAHHVRHGASTPAEIGPPHSTDAAQRSYLREVLDPLFGALHDRLADRSDLSEWYVLVLSDHGHTELIDDAEHALFAHGDRAPPLALLRAAGFRTRSLGLEAEADDFQAVLAAQSGMAFVYLADRTTCAPEGERCDWTAPPRFEQDVLAVADAFHRASREGALVAELRGTIDLVLARRPRPHAENDLPLEVYVGDGRLEPVDTYLAREPRPDYPHFERRLRELATGRRGERAGDVVLVAAGTGDAPIEQRVRFARPQRSGHGSPARSDVEVPLILARAGHERAALEALVQRALGHAPSHANVAALIERLREAPPAEVR
ncbi:MAG: alkaline phosphatase family protein [Myxococcota bacterium]|nr:alkaline phosphatase family protein [Myxococcota bacterium]